jgi:hypothetical protein
MPTDLPPDYKPQPANDPNNPVDPSVPGSKSAYPPETGEDARDPSGVQPPRPGADNVDPPGWPVPPVVPGGDKSDVPLPAGMPTF